ncbi:MAG: ATP-binding protein [Chloroflexota bacterium]|nr:ATP-binding protein [Chloroflexota bacterium]
MRLLYLGEFCKALINERYEVGSIIVTSNRAPAEWPDLFGNPLLASAGLDRLAHHAETVVITGTSFRAQGRRRDAPVIADGSVA